MQPEIKKILKYAYPYADDLELDRSIDLNWPVVNKILRRNKVKLTFLENMTKCINISENEIENFRREIENERARDVNHRIVKLSDLLLYGGIRHLFPKFSFFYREHGDVDVLVPADKYNETVKLLQSHGYALAEKEPWKARMSGQVKELADVVHVHGKVHWGLEFVPTDDIWKRSRPFSINDSHCVLIPSEEHCILLAAAHAIFESHMICLADVFQVEGIILRFPEINWRLVFKIAEEQGWLGAFYTFLVGVNAISSFVYDHTVIPKSVAFHAYALCKPLDKLMGIAAVADVFSRISGVPLYYSLSQVGLFFIGAAARRLSVSVMRMVAVYGFNAVLYHICKER